MSSDRNFYPDQPRPSYERIDIPQSDEEVRELLKRSVEAANNSIVLTDPNQPDNPIIYVNQGFKELTGYDESEILGHNCRFMQVSPGGGRDEEQPAVRTLARAIENGETCRVVLRNYRKDGEMFWNELYITPVYDQNDQLVNFIGVQNDITERVRLNESMERRVQERTRELEQKTRELEQQRDALARAKEEAEAASRAKSVFLANMSHEIRTPLTAMLGLADVIRAKSPDSRFDEHIRRIKSAGSRLMDTLSSLLTLAKLEAGNMDVNLEPVVVCEEALEVFELFRSRAEEKGLEATFDVEPEARDAVAHLDAGALNSALQNLISNAIKFTDDGTISVRVYCQNRDGPPADRVAIEFSDTGIGISDEFRPYLFEDFKQESDGLTREHEGSGLGLSITKQLVEAMDGSITVESEPGEGSVFTISFPLAEVQDRPRPAAETDRASPPPHQEARVLLVEDNDNTVFLIEDLLERSVDLTAVKSAQEALDAAEENGFDLFLVDVNLGAGGSGIDLMHALREREAHANAPILAVTAIAMPGDRAALLEEGFDDYLAKPFEARDLLDMIDAYL